ncbi:carbon storage regulator CsrA [Cellulosilyticum ruminicola]|uniref:carbon storage regulator CsrA n=1 Tax=Cellulosilyticum ruminicola TaxID=425254 RepID=UPI0006D01FF5|nr:carbon storage regulator CsrA [Cellulosilyticum ruminicola]
MLALTRKKNEAIIINDNIEVKVLEIIGDKVKLGISAPKEVNIYREEIYFQVLESNKNAAKTPKNVLTGINKLFR